MKNRFKEIRRMRTNKQQGAGKVEVVRRAKVVKKKKEV